MVICPHPKPHPHHKAHAHSRAAHASSVPLPPLVSRSLALTLAVARDDGIHALAVGLPIRAPPEDVAVGGCPQGCLPAVALAPSLSTALQRGRRPTSPWVACPRGCPSRRSHAPPPCRFCSCFPKGSQYDLVDPLLPPAPDSSIARQPCFVI